MRTVITGLQYLVGGLLGLVMAILPTLLVSQAILRPDGPVGEGFTIMFIYFLSCCACVPVYVALMSLHRKGQRGTRKLIACEICLRISMVVAACFLCFMAIKLPTRIMTKALFCLLPVFALTWAGKSGFWERSRA